MSGQFLDGASKVKSPTSPIRWWAREVIAITWWILVFTKLFVFDLDHYLAKRFIPEHAWLVSYRFIFVLTGLSLLAIMLQRGWFRHGLIYIGSYPVVVAFWYFPRLLLRHWELAVAFYPALDALVLRFWQAVVWLTITVNSMIAILFFNSPFFLYFGMVGLGACLIQVYWIEVRKSLWPTSVYASLAMLIRKSWGFTERRLLKAGQEQLAKLDPNTPAFKAKYMAILQGTYCVNSFLQWLAAKLKAVSINSALNVYLGVAFVLTFAFTVVAFAFIYLALHKLDASNFSGTENAGLWSFASYSLATLSGSSVSAIQAISGISQIVGHLETFCRWLLVGIGINFLVHVRKKGMIDDLKQVTDELDQGAASVERIMGSGFKLTLNDLEDIVLMESAKLVNWIRGLQGLEAREPPDTTSTPGFPKLESLIDEASTPPEEAADDESGVAPEEDLPADPELRKE